jgi:hypothetical protein
MIFEDRAVAFIDVLGFSNIAESAATNKVALQQLEALVNMLSSAVPLLDATVSASVPDRLIPAHLYISDCIILSAPISDKEMSGYKGLDMIVMRAIQLSHFFLSAGYLLRGGISVGKVWHTESNIVGPAYQEAYKLEANGHKPYIILSDNALKYWHGGSRMCLLDGSTSFVNGLFDYYIPDSTQPGVIRKTYAQYAVTVESMLASDMKESAKDKWRWFKAFLESESIEGLKWEQA